MKVILINGSARNNGSCSFILNKMKDAFERFSVRNVDKLEDLVKQNKVINEMYDFALQIYG